MIAFRLGRPLRSLRVEAGELLAQEQAGQADLERLKAQLIPAARQMERSRRLADIGAASEKEFESSRAEKEGIDASIRSQQALINGIHQRLRRFGISQDNPRSNHLTSLQAPFGGVVTKAQVSPGHTFETGKEVFTVADLQRIWVQAEVYEKDLGRLSVGQSAYITVDTYPNHPFEGKVAYISDVLDPQTRTRAFDVKLPIHKCSSRPTCSQTWNFRRNSRNRLLQCQPPLCSRWKVDRRLRSDVGEHVREARGRKRRNS